MPVAKQRYHTQQGAMEDRSGGDQERAASGAAAPPGPIYDVAVIGAGPAGAQAAVSAAHQMRHVLVLDAGPVSQRKGRAYWSKSVAIQDAPVFTGVTGPKLARALRQWMQAQPVRQVAIGGCRRTVGIELRDGMAMRVTKVASVEGERAPAGYLFDLEVSIEPLHHSKALRLAHFLARTLVVAAGFEDRWPEIEVDESAQRLYRRYRAVFRYAGNARGWHVCIRCDGHLHVDQHLAIVGTGDLAWSIARGAQDFTRRMTILTNGRPHGFTPDQLAKLRRRKIEIIEERIIAHIGRGTDLLGLRLADGRELFFDGFFVDEGLEPNTHYLKP